VTYLLATLAHKHAVATSAANGGDDGDGWAPLAADAAVLFATLYCACGSVVNYVQLSFVRLARPSPEALSVVNQQPPGAFFAVDILGYTFLSVSTLFLGISIEEKGLLRRLLYFHGIVGLGGCAAPLHPVCYGDEPTEALDWVLGLHIWSWVFASICIALSLRFHRVHDEMKERIKTSKNV